jgi:hypothetical protein
VAVGTGGSNIICYSSDGITWTAAGNSMFSEGFGVCWSGSRFVAVGSGNDFAVCGGDVPGPAVGVGVGVGLAERGRVAGCGFRDRDAQRVAEAAPILFAVLGGKKKTRLFESLKISAGDTSNGIKGNVTSGAFSILISSNTLVLQLKNLFSSWIAAASMASIISLFLV